MLHLLLSSSSTTTSPEVVTAAAVVATCTVAAIAYQNSKKKKNKQAARAWKIVPGWMPMLGHAHLIKSGNDFATQLESWADQFGNNGSNDNDNEDDSDSSGPGCFEIELGGKRIVCVCSEERAKEVLYHRPYTLQRLPQLVSAFDSVVPHSILTAEGKSWNKQHKFVAAALNQKHLNDYLLAFKTMSERLVQKWEDQIDAMDATEDGAIITVNDDLCSVSADTIAKVGMNREYDFLNQKESNMSKDVRVALGSLSPRFVSIVPYWKIPVIGQHLDGYGRAIASVTKSIRDIVAFELQKKNPNDDDDDSAPSRENDSNTTTQETFLDKIIGMAKEASSPASSPTKAGSSSPKSSSSSWVTHDRLVGNVMALFMAGTDTTSKSLTNALYVLGQDAELLQELQLEADTVDLFSELHSVQEMYQRLPRIKSFLHEVHRFYGLPLLGLYNASEKTVPFLNKTASIPPGTSVMVMTRYISTVSSETPLGPRQASPKEFCGRRWLSHDESTGKLTCPSPSNKSTSFMPFGHGVRSCPGRAYSEMLSYSILILLLQRFDWKLKEGHATPEIWQDITLDEIMAVEIVLSKRSSSKKKE